METFLWSGANSLAAREDAAQRLAGHLQRQAIAYPDAWQLVVGHSHGGSVIADALRRETPRERLAVVSIATPFLDLRTQPVGKLARTGLLLLLFLLFLGFGFSSNQKWLAVFLPDIFASAIVWLVTAGLSWIVTVRLLSDDDLARRLERKREQSEIEVPFLVLRSRFDEAALAILFGNAAERVFRFTRGVCTALALALSILLPAVEMSAGFYFLQGLIRQPGDPFLVGLALLVGGWILDQWRGACVWTGTCLLFAALLRSVNGRELVRCVEGVRARVSGVPGSIVAPRIELLRPRSCVAHSLYQHPEAAQRIALWLKQVVASTCTPKG